MVKEKKSTAKEKSKKDKVEEPVAGSSKDKADKKEKPEKKSKKAAAKPKVVKENGVAKDKEVVNDEVGANNGVTKDESEEKEIEPEPSQSKKAKAPKRKASKEKVVSKASKAKKKKDNDEEQADGAVVSKKPLLNATDTNYTELQFTIDKDTNYKISSWNVAGLRAWINKNGLAFIEQEKPDILCMQETKCTEDQLPDVARTVKGYHSYWLCKPGGRDGVAFYSKVMPYDVKYGLGDEEQDESGRLITAEYSKFYLICTYVPNAGRGLVTLDKRLRWDALFQAYVKKLDAVKPVIICGDMNVAHNEIDLANPKTNKKNAGFTQEERDGMTQLLSLGFVDTFRHLYPDLAKQYTFWTYMGNARAKNVGWRLDYFIVSERLLPKVVDHKIRDKVLGSDHCPITLFLKL